MSDDLATQFALQLNIVNLVVTAFLFVIIAAILATDLSRTTAQGRFSRKVLLTIIGPLTAAAFFWTIEYVFVIAHPTESIDYPLNTAISLLFFIAGSSLGGLRERLHPLMAPPRPPRRVDIVIGRLIGRRSMRVIAAVTFTVAFVWCMRNMPNEDGVVGTADRVQSGLAAIGMLVLGMGVLRELTRERAEAVSLICGASIIFYAFLQPLQHFLPTQPDYYLTRAASIALKVTFAVGIAGFWIVITESSRAKAKESASITALQHENFFLRSGLHNPVKANAIKIVQQLNAVKSVTTGNDIAAREADANLRLAQTLSEEIRSHAARLEAYSSGTRIWAGGIQRVVREQVGAFDRSGVVFDTSVDKVRWLPFSVEDAICGMIVEALTNIKKHADHVERIAVVVRQSGPIVSVEISSDQTGAIDPVKAGTGSGMLLMHETLIRFGGVRREPQVHDIGIRIEFDTRNYGGTL